MLPIHTVSCVAGKQHDIWQVIHYLPGQQITMKLYTGLSYEINIIQMIYELSTTQLLKAAIKEF